MNNTLLAILIITTVITSGCSEQQNNPKLFFYGLNEIKEEGNVLDCRNSFLPCAVAKYEGDDNQNITFLADTENKIPSPLTSQEYTVESLDVELSQPWDLEFLPDGSMLITERKGRVVQIKNNELTEVL